MGTKLQFLHIACLKDSKWCSHVDKMNLPVEKVAAVSELARRYQQKLFLPTFRDISSFCQEYMLSTTRLTWWGNYFR